MKEYINCFECGALINLGDSEDSGLGYLLCKNCLNYSYKIIENEDDLHKIEEIHED